MPLGIEDVNEIFRRKDRTKMKMEVSMKHKMENIREKFVEKKNEIMEFVDNEDGVGVIELVLVLVVLIGLVIIFKTQITQLLNNIFTEINSQSQEVY
jgi:Flp pilus assembly pilin Flp